MNPKLKKVDPLDGCSFHYIQEKEEFFQSYWHYHPEIELIWIQKSAGTLFIGDYIREFQAGDIHLIGSGLPHYFRNEPPFQKEKESMQTIVVKFLPDFLGEHFMNLPEMTGIASLLDRTEKGFHIGGQTAEGVKKRMSEIVTTTGVTRLMLLIEILSLLSQSGELTPLSSMRFYSENHRSQEKRMEVIIDYVMENFAEDIRQTDVAELIHMTSAAFSRYFKKTTGKRFTAFVNQLRVSKACKKLIESDLDITEISFQCGFVNLSNFNRQFKATKNMSPRSFRQKFRNIPKEDQEVTP